MAAAGVLHNTPSRGTSQVSVFIFFFFSDRITYTTTPSGFVSLETCVPYLYTRRRGNLEIGQYCPSYIIIIVVIIIRDAQLCPFCVWFFFSTLKRMPRGSLNVYNNTLSFETQPATVLRQTVCRPPPRFARDNDGRASWKGNDTFCNARREIGVRIYHRESDVRKYYLGVFKGPQFILPKDLRRSVWIIT